jgi:hypothetical protein
LIGFVIRIDSRRERRGEERLSERQHVIGRVDLSRCSGFAFACDDEPRALALERELDRAARAAPGMPGLGGRADELEYGVSPDSR